MSSVARHRLKILVWRIIVSNVVNITCTVVFTQRFLFQPVFGKLYHQMFCLTQMSVLV